MRKALRRDIRSCRRCLTSLPSVSIPVAQRMRMTSTDTSHKSLDSVFCHIQGPMGSKLTSYFQEQVASHLYNLDNIEEDKRHQAVKDAKLAVYQDICHKLVLPNILSTYMMATISSTEHLFQFRHSMVE